MRKMILGLSMAAAVSLGACASNDYYGDNEFRQEGRRALAGAAAGAAVGAGVGAVVDGVSTAEGAVAGAVVGGVVGAATASDRRWYRDRRGDCYYVNRYNERIYDYDRRC